MKKFCARVVISLILLSGSIAFANGSKPNVCDGMTGTFEDKCTNSYDSGRDRCIVTCKNDKDQDIINTLTISSLQGREYYTIKTGSNSPKGYYVHAVSSFGCDNGVLFFKPL